MTSSFQTWHCCGEDACGVDVSSDRSNLTDPNPLRKRWLRRNYLGNVRTHIGETECWLAGLGSNNYVKTVLQRKSYGATQILEKLNDFDRVCAPQIECDCRSRGGFDEEWRWVGALAQRTWLNLRMVGLAARCVGIDATSAKHMLTIKCPAWPLENTEGAAI